MKLLINRKYYHDCTISRVSYGGFQCFMLEPPYLDNKVNVSCIDEGVYSAKKRISPSRGYEVLEYENVDGRSYIQIHKGNEPKDTKGCQLVGSMVGFYSSSPFVAHSESTFNWLMELLPNKVTVIISSQ